MRQRYLCAILLAIALFISGCNGTPPVMAARTESAVAQVTRNEEPDPDVNIDITPDAVLREIGCRIYKNPKEHDSYISYKDQKYPITKYFGGGGVADIHTCDFDQDGKKDLIYTYGWGSGMHRSMIAIFYFSTLKETTLDYVNVNSDTMLEKVTDTHFIVYDADWAGDDNGLFVHLIKGKQLTEITCETNQPVVGEPHEFDKLQ